MEPGGSEEGVPQGCRLLGPASRAKAPAFTPQVLGCPRMVFVASWASALTSVGEAASCFRSNQMLTWRE